MEVKALAKVNLALSIVGARPDGYHDIATVMHRVELADEIDIVRVARPGSGIRVISDSDDVPCGAENLAYRAAAAYIDAVRPTVSMGVSAGTSVSRTAAATATDGVVIRVRKRIPVAAGLGGGSSDAAAVLLGMNEMWGKPLGPDRLADIGRRLGADVPFFLMCNGDKPLLRAAYAEGIGDRIRAVAGLPRLPVVLAKPAFGFSTARMYSMWDAEQSGASARADAMTASALAKELSRGRGDSSGLEIVSRISPMMHNSFEPIAIRINPCILYIKNRMLDLGAAAAMMSGSGPTVLGIYDTDEKALNAANILRVDSAHGYELRVIITRF